MRSHFPPFPRSGKNGNGVVGLVEEFRFLISVPVPSGDLIQPAVGEEVGHAGPPFLVECLPVVARADDDVRLDAGQLFQSAVPVENPMGAVDEKRRSGGAFEDRLQAFLAFPKRHFGEFSLRDVLQGLESADEVPLGVPEGRRGEPEPFPRRAEGGEEIRRLEGFLDEVRFLVFVAVPPGDLILQAVGDEVGHAGPFPAVKGPPVFPRSDDPVRREPAQFLKGPVPVKDPVVPADDEGGDGKAFQDGPKHHPPFRRQVLKAFDSLLHRPCLAFSGRRSHDAPLRFQNKMKPPEGSTKLSPGIRVGGCRSSDLTNRLTSSI